MSDGAEDRLPRLPSQNGAVLPKLWCAVLSATHVLCAATLVFLTVHRGKMAVKIGPEYWALRGDEMERLAPLPGAIYFIVARASFVGMLLAGLLYGIGSLSAGGSFADRLAGLYGAQPLFRRAVITSRMVLLVLCFGVIAAGVVGIWLQ